jgi:hypothetical protein
MSGEAKNRFTIEEVQNLRVDALYGKKKHYNAADRKKRYHTRLGVTQVVLNVLLGSYLFGATSIAMPNALNWVVGILALVSATSAALQTFYNFERQAELHRSIGTRYLAVAKECSRIIAYHRDGAIGATALREQLEQLAQTCNQINADSEKCPTSDQDYEKAQQAFASGEEAYTAAEKEHRGE